VSARQVPGIKYSTSRREEEKADIAPPRTLPGIMDEPGAIAGRLISLKPARGPEDSKRRSLQILEIFTAILRNTPAYKDGKNVPETERR
jgi:hypothetical protein